MREQELRDLLARVVPAAPDRVATAAPVVLSAHRSRRRRRVLAATILTTAAVVITSAVLVVNRPAILDTGPTSRAVSPYSPPPCTEITAAGEARAPVDLSDVTSIRVCANRAVGAVAPLDALVTHFDDLAGVVAEMAAAGTSYGGHACGLSDFVVAPVVLEVVAGDGAPTAVDTHPCQNVEVDGREVDAHRFEQAVLDQLDAQRTALAYTASRPAVTSCDQKQTEAPAQPARDGLVAAVLCPAGARAATPISPGSLAALQSAWARPGPVVPRPCPTSQRADRVVATTNRGDIVDLTDRGCGPLVFTPRQAFDTRGTPSAIPIPYARLC